jgi:hypothetical protein
LASAGAVDYTYLTLPPERSFRSCIGLVVAGLAARAKIGVAGLEEAIELLENQHALDGPTRYRFYLKEDSLIAEVEERKPATVRGGIGASNDESGWRTVVEMVS